MKSSYKRYFLALMITGSMGCYKPVENVELPNEEPKLVVFCFISPEDSVIKVTVTRSHPIFYQEVSNEYPPITDATVQISGSQGSVTIPYNASRQAYYLSQNDYAVLPGRIYTLTVTSMEGEKVSASTTVPEKNKANLDISSSYVDTMTEDFWSRRHVVINAKWQDDPKPGNYYRLHPLLIDSTEFGIETITIVRYADMGMVTDKADNGKTIKLIYSNEDIHYFGNPLRSKLLIYLYHVDKHYYHYHQSLRQVGSDETPFSQPSPYYNNIDGGIGAFGSYRTQWAEKEV